MRPARGQRVCAGGLITRTAQVVAILWANNVGMELFCILLSLPDRVWSFVLYSNQLTYIEYEASNIYT